MKYTEELLWILDKPGKMLSMDEKIRKNIEFVHSLGLQCDGVGWCNLNLSQSDAEEILDRIERFCREDDWQARGIYKRSYTDLVSDWYELAVVPLRDGTFAGKMTLIGENGKEVSLCELRAYSESAATPKLWGTMRLVPERFRNACLLHNLEGLEFCWATDKGKYAAEQYFHVYGRQCIPRVGVDWELKKLGRQGLLAAGGSLPRLGEVFHTLQQIILPDCYLAEDMPAGEFAYAYIPQTFSCAGRHTILVHKDTAEVLLQEKAIPVNALRSVPVVDSVPGGYVLWETEPISRPEATLMERRLREYEKLKATPRPVRMISEKEAVKLLRKAKKERKADFRKGMPKAKAALLAETEQATLAAYYLVADGGYLSEEYELLPYERAIAETTTFFESLRGEELLQEKPEGFVVAICPDGDVVLLLRDGTVIRYSHEAPEKVAQWPSFPQFAAEALSHME